jgi:sulfate transport system substrate-binding protein
MARPRQQVVEPVPAKLWTIADLGGWPAVDSQLFDKKSGSITKFYTQATG